MKSAYIGLALGISAMTCMAQSKSFWEIGGSAGYAVGGDLEENNFVPGVHLAWQKEVPNAQPNGLPFGFFVDLSWARVEDGLNEDVDGVVLDAEMEVDEYAMVLGLNIPMSPKTTFDLAAGVGYYDPSFSVEVDASNIGAANGIPELTADFDVQTEIDPAFGAIFGLGLTYKASESFELFADYRFHVVEFDAELTGSALVRAGSRSETISVNEEVEGTFNHGVLRAGVSLRL